MWQRTDPSSPRYRELDFSKSSKTLYQERWLAKRLTKGYHGDHIGATVFERWYLPDALPVMRHDAGKKQNELAKWVEGRSAAGGRTQHERRIAQLEKDGLSPVGTMMYGEVERRLDVLIFRACFATSVWQARSYVVQGHVRLNGKLVSSLRARRKACERRNQGKGVMLTRPVP